jgi:hypothetical protein
VRLWNKKDLKDVMNDCIILHNMIVEDQREDEETVESVHDVENYDDTPRQRQCLSTLETFKIYGIKKFTMNCERT